MSYNKHNFQTGDLIKASDFNELENQVATNEQNISGKADKSNWTLLKTITTNAATRQVTVIDYNDGKHYRNVRLHITFPAATASSNISFDVRHVGANPNMRCELSASSVLNTSGSKALFEMYEDDGLLMNKFAGVPNSFYTLSNGNYILEFPEEDYFDNIWLKSTSADIPAGTVIKIYTK